MNEPKIIRCRYCDKLFPDHGMGDYCTAECCARAVNGGPDFGRVHYHRDPVYGPSNPAFPPFGTGGGSGLE
jgi:hypothetical protein